MGTVRRGRLGLWSHVIMILMCDHMWSWKPFTQCTRREKNRRNLSPDCYVLCVLHHSSSGDRRDARACLPTSGLLFLLSHLVDIFCPVSMHEQVSPVNLPHCVPSLHVNATSGHVGNVPSVNVIRDPSPRKFKTKAADSRL